MSAQPSFDRTAPLGRLTLFVGSYAPVLVVLGLRIGLDGTGKILCAAGAVGTVVWVAFLLGVVRGRQTWEITLAAAEPADRDVAAYVASYLLPVLVAKPQHFTGYLAYGLAGFLIVVVAYRADLGAINPIAYLCGYRAYLVSADDGVRIVLSRSLLVKGATWQMQEVAGIVVAKQLSVTTAPSGEDRH